MCFSAEASFIVGGALIPAGGYCVWSACRKQLRYLGLAVIPLFFGIQQISEGVVWLQGEPRQASCAALVFVFFAFAFWPFWFPFFATLLETQPTRRRILAVVSILASAWFWVLFYPLLADHELLKIKETHHSIQYDIDSLPIYAEVHAPKWLMRALYFLTLAAPFAIGSQPWGVLPGLMLGLSVVVSMIVYNYAFISVWCFFAAVLTFYICFIFQRLPPSAPGHKASSGL